MEKKQSYKVVITPEAESYYFDVLEYFYKHHSETVADCKSADLLELGIGLDSNPYRGRVLEELRSLGRKHRFILYYYTTRKAIKIIYFIDEQKMIVYVTDFFPCESNETKISKR